jgi:peptide/nickel transport system permease protein
VAGLARTLWTIIRRDRMASVGLTILVAMLAIAAFAPLIATHDPNAVNERVEGVAVHHDGEGWRDIDVIGDAPLNGVALAAAGTGVAVGFEGEAALLVDGEWDDADVGVDVTLRGVDTADGLTVAVGDGGVALHLVDGAWEAADTGTDADLNGVAVAAADHALAVGVGGTVLRWDGSAWSELDADTARDLHAVTLVDERFGVVAGDRGTLLLYDGEGFEAVEGLGFRQLFGVDALDRDTILAVGERGTILKSAGGEWEEMRPPESRDLRDVRLLAPDAALTVGTHGVVMRMQGEEWEREHTGYGQTLRALAAVEGEIVAVGTDPFVDQLAGPSRHHVFGTTHLGRDIFSQTIWGSRTALMVGLLAALMVVLIGTNVGLIAGYFKGKTGSFLMRFVDVMYALPFEPFALVLVLLFRPSLAIIILAIGLLTWRTTARIIRSQVLTLSERPFVKAARVAGASDWRILYVHIAPNVLPLAFLQLAVAMAFAITAEATLSFLGLGPPQIYSWGSILHEARLSGAWRTAWWWIIPPGLFIMVTVVAVFFIARALEVLTNPRLAARA